MNMFLLLRPHVTSGALRRPFRNVCSFRRKFTSLISADESRTSSEEAALAHVSCLTRPNQRQNCRAEPPSFTLVMESGGSRQEPASGMRTHACLHRPEKERRRSIPVNTGIRRQAGKSKSCFECRRRATAELQLASIINVKEPLGTPPASREAPPVAWRKPQWEAERPLWNAPLVLFPPASHHNKRSPPEPGATTVTQEDQSCDQRPPPWLHRSP